MTTQMTLREMIQACGFFTETPSIASYFPESCRRETSSDTTILEIERPMYSQEVQNLLTSKGLRTATIHELVEFALKNPTLPDVGEIVSLDGGPIMGCYAYVLSSMWDGRRSLSQLPQGTKWYPYPHFFLVAPK